MQVDYEWCSLKCAPTCAACTQVLKALGGQYFLGVNYSAMHKYPCACTPEQWRHCVSSLKVR